MIEVEVNIHLQDIAHFLKSAKFVGERVIQDVYYDTSDCILTLKDVWLRNRNGRFELKLPLNRESDIRDRKADEYREIEKEEGIRKALLLPEQGTFEEDLKQHGYLPFAKFKITRKKYKREGFAIDIDSTDFGHKTGEIELLVEKESEIAAARERIIEFMSAFHVLPEKKLQGKVETYIKRFRPLHFQSLVAAGVVYE